MPDGQVQWIDSERGVVQLARGGHEYRAPLEEVESAARVPGVRVHFDIVRDGGVEGASNVTLRRGSRSNKRHRRFGDLTGARVPGSKASSAAAKRLGVDVAAQPMRVVRSWLVTLAAGNVDDALALYSPDAVVHSGDIEHRGRGPLRSYLADDAPRGFDVDAVEVSGLDEQICVDWPVGMRFGGSPPTDVVTSTVLSVDHGRIQEEWERVDPTELAEEPGPSFVYVSDGPLSKAEEDYVRTRFEHMISSLNDPVLFTRVKLSVFEGGRHRERPVAASATIDLDGHVVRAHVGAASVTEAIDELVSRLGRQTRQLAEREHSWPTGQHADPDTWHHGKVSEVRPGYFDRPADEREIVRHKSYSPDESTVEEALWDMGVLDYDFFLFTEMSTGQECLLARDDEGLLLHMTGPSALALEDVLDRSDLKVVPIGAAVMSFSDAVQRLDDGNEPFVFFRNQETSRGNVVYRRYDGHYGVITPSNES